MFSSNSKKYFLITFRHLYNYYTYIFEFRHMYDGQSFTIFYSNKIHIKKLNNKLNQIQQLNADIYILNKACGQRKQNRVYMPTWFYRMRRYFTSHEQILVNSNSIPNINIFNYVKILSEKNHYLYWNNKNFIEYTI